MFGGLICLWFWFLLGSCCVCRLIWWFVVWCSLVVGWLVFVVGVVGRVGWRWCCLLLLVLGRCVELWRFCCGCGWCCGCWVFWWELCSCWCWIGIIVCFFGVLDNFVLCSVCWLLDFCCFGCGWWIGCWVWFCCGRWGVWSGGWVVVWCLVFFLFCGSCCFVSLGWFWWLWFVLFVCWFGLWWYVYWLLVVIWFGFDLGSWLFILGFGCCLWSCWWWWWFWWCLVWLVLWCLFVFGYVLRLVEILSFKVFCCG